MYNTENLLFMMHVILQLFYISVFITFIYTVFNTFIYIIFSLLWVK